MAGSAAEIGGSCDGTKARVSTVSSWVLDESGTWGDPRRVLTGLPAWGEFAGWRRDGREPARRPIRRRWWAF